MDFGGKHYESGFIGCEDTERQMKIYNAPKK